MSDLLDLGARQESIFMSTSNAPLPIYPGPVPPNAEYAEQYSNLSLILRTYVAPGYEVSPLDFPSIGILWADVSGFAVRKSGTDPATGQPHPVELAFELREEMKDSELVNQRAKTLSQQGARRIFAIVSVAPAQQKPGAETNSCFLVTEWFDRNDAWLTRDPEDIIIDAGLILPLKIGAFVDGGDSNEALGYALIRSRDPMAIRLLTAIAELSETRDYTDLEKDISEEETQALLNDVVELCAGLGVTMDEERFGTLNTLTPLDLAAFVVTLYQEQEHIYEEQEHITPGEDPSTDTARPRLLR